MIEVTLEPQEDGWTAEVQVRDEAGETVHQVRVSAADLARLSADDPAELVRRSFEFLLAREPATSILRRFALSDIGRYFPEYEREIRR